MGQASLPVTNARALRSRNLFHPKTPTVESSVHLRQDHAAYFVTWRLANGQPKLDSRERELVMAAIRNFAAQRYNLLRNNLSAYVVMDDHVHVLVAPIPPNELRSILHSWNSFTARQMQRDHNRIGRVWQDEYFDLIVRDNAELVQRADYILTRRKGGLGEGLPLGLGGGDLRVLQGGASGKMLARRSQAGTPVPLFN